jgi:hypothetical protein
MEPKKDFAFIADRHPDGSLRWKFRVDGEPSKCLCSSLLVCIQEARKHGFTDASLSLEGHQPND